MPYKPLLSYLPDYWHHVSDIKVLYDAVEKELEKGVIALSSSLDDQFILTMSEDRIKSYEDMFKLTSGRDPLEERRKRLISIVSRSTPFSLPFLIQYLNNFLGEKNWYHYIYMETYTYALFVEYRQKEKLAHLQKIIDSVMPAHIVLEYEFFFPASTSIDVAIQPMRNETLTYQVSIKE